MFNLISFQMFNPFVPNVLNIVSTFDQNFNFNFKKGSSKSFSKRVAPMSR